MEDHPVTVFETIALSGGPARGGEPALEELYADPVLQALLRRDGVELSALRRLVAAARNKLAA